MLTRAAVLSVVTLLVVVAQRADASGASGTLSDGQPYAVLRLSDLRSAYLQRAGMVRYDESQRTPEGLRQQLRRHFDVVLALLDLATPDSVETAVARLEAADDHAWTIDERAARRQTLLAARHVQLRRLAAYRDRGTFPLNEGQSAHAVPIFVDRHDTACAVGHLMRCAGRTRDVDSIEDSDNLIYVPDATRGALAEWVLSSGLTLEEAALIQPGYYWLAGQFNASDYEPGELVLEKDGLRFSNFKLVPPTGPITGPLPALAGLGLSAGKGTYTGGPLQYQPAGTHWIAIGGTDSRVQSPLHALNALAVAGVAEEILVSFDVATIDPGQQINGISEAHTSIWQGFQDPNQTFFAPPPTATYHLQTTASDGAATLASLNVDRSLARSSGSFAPTQQISVQSSILVQDGVRLDTYFLDFNVVPEPASGLLAAAVIAVSGLTRSRARRANTSDGSGTRRVSFETAGN